jgi:hypothetical protein
MKTFFTLLVLIVLVNITSAQNAKFIDAMTKGLEALSNSGTAEEVLATSNRFERIAKAEKTEWLPYYYAAYSRALYSFFSDDKSKVDEILDVAQSMIDVADSLSPKNSEVILAKAMILSGRIMVDPMSRVMQYGMQSGMLMNEAMQIDPENPRSYFMMGQSLFYTPAEFGGGKEAGCAMLEKSREKYATFTPESEIHPNWGEEKLIELLQQCSNGEVGE